MIASKSLVSPAGIRSFWKLLLLSRRSSPEFDTVVVFIM
jgi:hypothetical protein